MLQSETRYWFRAKRYGWGWGLPLNWQGWAVLVVFVLLLAVGGVFVSPDGNPVAYALYASGLSAALVGVCYWKGEPPKWRWGGR